MNLQKATQEVTTTFGLILAKIPQAILAVEHLRNETFDKETSLWRELLDQARLEAILKIAEVAFLHQLLLSNITILERLTIGTNQQEVAGSLTDIADNNYRVVLDGMVRSIDLIGSFEFDLVIDQLNNLIKITRDYEKHVVGKISQIDSALTQAN